MLAWITTVAFGAPNPQIPPLDWDWSEPRRYLAEAQVRLPYFLWFRAARNRDVRVVGFQLRAVLRCQGTDRYDPARRDEVFCDVEDLSLVVGTQPGDRGLGADVAQEYAEVLTGATVRVVLHAKGRILDLDLLHVPSRNARLRGRNELLRQLLRYAVMGFEIPLTDGGEDRWFTGSSILCTLPSTRGTVAPVEAVHVAALRKPGVVELASHIRGLIAAGSTPNVYTCEATARAFVSPTTGVLRHSWELVGEPTPSSPIAFGAAGYPYTLRGGLRRLGPEERPDLGPSGEVEVEGDETSIQQTDPAL